MSDNDINCRTKCDDLSAVNLPELMSVTNWQQQYKLIIQWGKLIQPKADIRVSDNLIKGCDLPVWLIHETRGNLHFFAFDSDSSVMNGLAALLLVQANGQTSEQLRALDMTASLHALGLERHLTPSRNNGLKAIIARLQNFA